MGKLIELETTAHQTETVLTIGGKRNKIKKAK